MPRQKAEPRVILSNADIPTLESLERKILWLSSWMIHNANHLRKNRDKLKVGGHQSSCASATTLLTALYLHSLRPEDRVAVKPHAAPVFHAIQYLLGRQDVDKLINFRALGGAQSYPSRTKDTEDVDFSTGSVGLGVGATLFGAMVRDYVQHHNLAEGQANGRLVALMGDAELDEGNVFEALLEGWKHDVRNLWWVIDYNRQSLDGVVHDYLFQRIKDFFGTVGWNVVELKYGKLQTAAFQRPGGEALRDWIDACPNQLYAALTYQGGDAWRNHLKTDIGNVKGIRTLLDEHDDNDLQRLMTNLGGHDMAATLEAFADVGDNDTPQCFVAYTIKGFNTPLAGHKDNHSGLMNPDQMAAFKESHAIRDGHEWDVTEGLDISEEALAAFLADVPFAQRQTAAAAPKIPVMTLPVPEGKQMSTQEAFGQILNDLGRSNTELADRIVTTTPDVTVTTNMAGWVNQRGLFHHENTADVFREQQVPSAFKWSAGPSGQHIELGIAENNLFLLLAALGLSDQLFGARLLPVGALYDPFIARGLDSLNYACYQDARFMAVATPSGITLAPEGGAHQSINSPLIGLSQPGLTSFEPAFADELAHIMKWSFEYMQADDGGAVYLRLSTHALNQPQRNFEHIATDVLAGAYWLREPAPGAEIAIVYTGVVVPEAVAAHDALLEDIPGAGLLAVTSADRLFTDWQAATQAHARGSGSALSHIEILLGCLAPDAGLVTVLDGHPATLAWLGGVAHHDVAALGVESFGQSGDLPDLYRTHGIDTNAILDGAAAVITKRMGRRKHTSAASVR
ncbi:MAG: transketolase [Alphaproteobacteria bacterium]|nr:transketolase [Alphaproteobacteria bacterium]HCP01141.1 transketolase [Rhodospirillaceae bacterium]